MGRVAKAFTQEFAAAYTPEARQACTERYLNDKLRTGSTPAQNVARLEDKFAVIERTGGAHTADMRRGLETLKALSPLMKLTPDEAIFVQRVNSTKDDRGVEDATRTFLYGRCDEGPNPAVTRERLAFAMGRVMPRVQHNRAAVDAAFFTCSADQVLEKWHLQRRLDRQEQRLNAQQNDISWLQLDMLFDAL